jgi:hypothetical protein
MLFCQQCGAENSGDARFCNQCGSRIASAGEPGGPLPEESEEAPPASEEAPPTSEETLLGHDPDDEPVAETAQEAPPPQASFDVSTISLSAIGVRSRTKAWSVLIAITLFLISLGAGGAWLVLSRKTDAPRAQNDPAPVEIGDAIPEGAEVPDIDFVPGSPRPARHSERATPTRTTPEAAHAPTRTIPEAARPPTPTEAPRPARAAHTSEPAPARAPTKTHEPAPNAPANNASPPAEEPDWEQMEEEDDEMDEYASRVRSFIRTYYARRAQGCFEHESRNNEQVRGTVLIAFSIRQDGNVDNAHVARNTTGLDSLGACLANQVNGWRLPVPPEAPLPMQMPFSR